MSAKVLTIASDAVDMIISLRDQEPGDQEYGLAIEVSGIRGAQFQYELSFVPVEDQTGTQIREDHDGLAILIPEHDVEKLSGASLELTPQGLAMNNPNLPQSPTMAAAEPRGDLTGPLAEKISTILTENINPAIAMHGGMAELVSVDGTVAFLRLSGGCQGCGMAQVTLRQGIERILRESLPEISEVVDVTDHASGSDPYYQASKK
ncbi:MAG: NifU family protein [bacterium]|nr:NifU family protein [bacterium]MDE0602236.1 NifU family protein [bacterium]